MLSDVNRPDLSSLFKSYMSSRKTVSSRRRKRNLGGGLLVDVDDAEYAELIAYWDRMFPGWDDSEGDVIYPEKLSDTAPVREMVEDDPYNMYWSQEEREDSWSRSLMGKFGNNRKKKHKRKRSRSKAKVIDIRKPITGFIGDDEYNLDDIHYENTSPGIGPSGKVIFYFDYHDNTDYLEFENLMEFSDFCEREGYFVPGYVEDDILYRNENHCCLNPIAKSRGVLEVMAESSWGEMFYEACDESELGY